MEWVSEWVSEWVITNVGTTFICFTGWVMISFALLCSESDLQQQKAVLQTYTLHSVVSLLRCPARVPLCVFIKKSNLSTHCQRMDSEQHISLINRRTTFPGGVMKWTRYGEKLSVCPHDFSLKRFTEFGKICCSVVYIKCFQATLVLAYFSPI
jgi:hypothetical protein